MFGKIYVSIKIYRPAQAVKFRNISISIVINSRIPRRPSLKKQKVHIKDKNVIFRFCFLKV